MDHRSRDEWEDINPLRPPGHVEALIPEWKSCDPVNCGKHSFPDLTDDNFSTASRGTPSDRPEERTCISCKYVCPIAALHSLPCGHTLCCRCLLDAVSSIKELINSQYRKIDYHLVEATKWHAYIRDVDDRLERDWGESQRQEHHNSALSIAGFMCCGTFMELRRYVSCMKPEVARFYWLAERFMWEPPQQRRRCGWPDCKEFIPHKCSWTETNGGVGLRWHCVKCGGNSTEGGYQNGLVPAR